MSKHNKSVSNIASKRCDADHSRIAYYSIQLRQLISGFNKATQKDEYDSCIFRTIRFVETVIAQREYNQIINAHKAVLLLLFRIIFNHQHAHLASQKIANTPCAIALTADIEVRTRIRLLSTLLAYCAVHHDIKSSSQSNINKQARCDPDIYDFHLIEIIDQTRYLSLILAKLASQIVQVLTIQKNETLYKDDDCAQWIFMMAPIDLHQRLANTANALHKMIIKFRNQYGRIAIQHKLTSTRYSEHQTWSDIITIINRVIAFCNDIVDSKLCSHAMHDDNALCFAGTSDPSITFLDLRLTASNIVDEIICLGSDCRKKMTKQCLDNNHLFADSKTRLSMDRHNNIRRKPKNPNRKISYAIVKKHTQHSLGTCSFLRRYIGEKSSRVLKSKFLMLVIQCRQCTTKEISRFFSKHAIYEHKNFHGYVWRFYTLLLHAMRLCQIKPRRDAIICLEKIKCEISTTHTPNISNQLIRAWNKYYPKNCEPHYFPFNAPVSIAACLLTMPLTPRKTKKRIRQLFEHFHLDSTLITQSQPYPESANIQCSRFLDQVIQQAKPSPELNQIINLKKSVLANEFKKMRQINTQSSTSQSLGIIRNSAVKDNKPPTLNEITDDRLHIEKLELGADQLTTEAEISKHYTKLSQLSSSLSLQAYIENLQFLLHVISKKNYKSKMTMLIISTLMALYYKQMTQLLSPNTGIMVNQETELNKHWKAILSLQAVINNHPIIKSGVNAYYHFCYDFIRALTALISHYEQLDKYTIKLTHLTRKRSHYGKIINIELNRKNKKQPDNQLKNKLQQLLKSITQRRKSSTRHKRSCSTINSNHKAASTTVPMMMCHTKNGHKTQTMDAKTERIVDLWLSLPACAYSDELIAIFDKVIARYKTQIAYANHKQKPSTLEYNHHCYQLLLLLSDRKEPDDVHLATTLMASMRYDASVCGDNIYSAIQLFNKLTKDFLAENQQYSPLKLIVYGSQAQKLVDNLKRMRDEKCLKHRKPKQTSDLDLLICYSRMLDDPLSLVMKLSHFIDRSLTARKAIQQNGLLGNYRQLSKMKHVYHNVKFQSKHSTLSIDLNIDNSLPKLVFGHQAYYQLSPNNRFQIGNSPTEVPITCIQQWTSNTIELILDSSDIDIKVAVFIVKKSYQCSCQNIRFGHRLSTFLHKLFINQSQLVKVMIYFYTRYVKDAAHQAYYLALMNYQWPFANKSISIHSCLSAKNRLTSQLSNHPNNPNHTQITKKKMY